MRAFFLFLALAAAGISRAYADSHPFRAGAVIITVRDAVPFETFVAYPTRVAELPFRVGPFLIAAGRDAPIAAERRFPIVLFSHGNGRSKGTSLVHQELLVSLAREGFIVIAPFHPGTTLPLVDRPGQIRKALDVISTDPRFSAHADAVRIGMIGFSFGGAVALGVAGAQPNPAHLIAYCRNHADDRRACDGVPTEGPATSEIPRRSTEALALKALVLMEPFGAVFDQAGLKSVDMPTLIYRAERSDLMPGGNIFALAAGLPRPPRHETTPGGHFVFVDACPALLEQEAPTVCKDAPDVDRVAIHRRLKAQIADFFRQNL